MAIVSTDDLHKGNFYTSLIAEFLGTLILVMFTCGSTFAGDFVQISLSFGFTVASVVWAFGRVSGGHVNPCVTVGFLSARRIGVIRGLCYIAMQTLGGIIGALLLKSMSEPESNLGKVAITKALISVEQGFGIEFFCGFVLVLVVFSSVDNNRRDLNGSTPLTIGLSVAMCHLWAVRYTGCGMNPARALGPAVATESFDDQWLYWLGPMLGGACAAWLYELVFAVNANHIKAIQFCTAEYDESKFGKEDEVQLEMVTDSTNEGK